MSVRTKVTAVVVLLIGLGVLLFAIRSCEADDAIGGEESTPSAEPTPSESLAPIKMSTEQISDAIKATLDENAQQPTRVECPEEVEQKVGTTFECEVFFADQPNTAAVSIATVEISGPDGTYTWEAVSNN